MAQDATLEEIANGKLRPLSAHNKSLVCTDVRARDSARFHRVVGRKSAPKRRGQAAALDIDETGGTAKFQGKPFRVARFCVRK